MPEVFAGRHNFEKGKGVFGVRHPDAKMVRHGAGSTTTTRPATKNCLIWRMTRVNS